MSDDLFDATGEPRPDALPALPYAGTSGWSGSDTSHERQQRQDDDGTTTIRQRRLLTWLAACGPEGATWKEVADRYSWHHGQASGALSTLHKEGHVARLAHDRRMRCAVYVLPEHVRDRDTAPHGRQETEKDRELARLGALVESFRAISEAVVANYAQCCAAPDTCPCSFAQLHRLVERVSTETD